MKPMELLGIALVSFLAVSAPPPPLFGGGQSGSTSERSITGTQGAEGGSIGYPAGPVTYPLKADITLTYWVPLSGNISPNYPNYGETPFGKGLAEKTGIKIEWIHPPSGSVTEQFNLMIAGGDLPDIIERNWLNFPGGPEKAIADGVIVRLNDLLAKYGPHLSSYLKANREYDKMIKTDSGTYYCFPFLRDHPGLLVFQGPLIRKDWLDDLGLSMPETIDEWHTVLTAFKQKKGSPVPFTFEYTTESYNNTFAFALAYNAPPRFYVGDDGKVHFGAIEDGRREYLKTFSQWYREGLVDPDLATLRFQQVSAKIVGNISGASFGTLGSRMGTWIESAKGTNPKFNLVPAPFPVLRKGDKPKMTSTDIAYPATGSAAITTASKHPELATRLLDWGYSNDGHLFYNFGIEGESYTMINGYPTFTDAIMNNPKGWTLTQSIHAYARAKSDGPLVQDIRHLEQFYGMPAQKEGVKIWSIEGATKYVLPTISPTPEESQEFARIMSEINTYRNEMETKFILGTENLANWDNYVSTIKRMGIDRAIEINNVALARYNAR
jgi:putative aldouronate transport system substrate-binding protein